MPRNWARLEATDSEMFRILRLGEKLNKSVVHQLLIVVTVFTPKDWLTTRFNAMQQLIYQMIYQLKVNYNNVGFVRMK
jgi:hypothetical protein